LARCFCCGVNQRRWKLPRSLLELSLQSLIYSVPGLRVGKIAHTGTTNESGANHIGQIALCHPHVTWQVWQNDREWFSISPGATTQQLLPQLLRQVRLGDLQQLKVEIPTPQGEESDLTPYSSPSWLGLPDRCHRHRPDWVRVAVNRDGW